MSKPIYIVPKYWHIIQNTDGNKKAYIMTELTNSCIHDKLNNHKDANPNDNYDILHNTLSGIGAKCMSTEKV